MSDGQRSGRSTGRVSCKSTELKRCSMIEMRWKKYEVSLASPVWTQIRLPSSEIKFRVVELLLLLLLWPRYSIPREWKKYAMQYKKVQKSSWNEPYFSYSSSSSSTKQSCSKMVLYRWIIIIVNIIITCVEEVRIWLAGLEVEARRVAVADDRVGLARQIVREVVVTVQSHHRRRLLCTHHTASSPSLPVNLWTVVRRVGSGAL